MSSIYKKSLELHKKIRGKIAVTNKVDVLSADDLSLVYSPGVAEPCREIAKNPDLADIYTMKGNTVAVVSDGTAVLGLGDIGPLASLPVMEGKAMLFKAFGNIDAFPLVLNTTNPQEIINTVKNIAPGFAGINLEDISAPRCFEIEQALQDIGIPVFHDDQDGTAIVTLAGIINACKVVGKKMEDLYVVVNGAGAAGVAITKMLLHAGVADVVLCDSKGIISADRDNLIDYKREILSITNKDNRSGEMQLALTGADVFIGVSAANVLSKDDVATMNDKAIVFAMANPDPEILPQEAKAAGAAVVGTGRSDHANQVNNVLCFPSLFRGALDAKAKKITTTMKLAAAYAIASSVEDLSADKVIPDPFDKKAHAAVAKAVYNAVVNN